MASLSPDSLFSTINSARIEGRLENILQRKKELQKLYTSIQSHEAPLISSFHSDLEWGTSQSHHEISSTLQTLKQLYESLNFKQSLQDEYPSEHSIHRRRPLGCILIIAENESPLSQTAIQLALAIAAGNTSLLLLSPSIHSTSKVLYEIIKTAVDSESCAAVLPRNQEEFIQLVRDFSTRKFQGVVVQSQNVLDQLPLAQEYVLNREVIYLAPVPSVVIITRNADIELAAREIALAKSSYSTSSPSLVMVDEFVVDKFVGALEKEISSHPQISNTSEKEGSVEAGFEKHGGKVKRITDDAVLLIGNAEWKSLKNFPPSSKNGELAILPTTSMEVSLSIFTNLDPTPPLQIFSNASESRYLTLFTPSAPATYLNHISISHTPFSLSTLSIILERFSHPNPIFIHPATKKISSLLEEKIEPPYQKSGFQIGFFPQGGMVGMGHLLVAVGLVGVGCWWVGERVWKRW